MRNGWIVSMMLVGMVPGVLHAWQAPSGSRPLVFEGAIVVDVEQGKLIADQRVVITGNRIRAMGNASAVKVPAGAQIVEASGKYLIPGLWDMHTHSGHKTDFFYPLFLASGVTGIRDAGSPVPLDTLRRWRQEILAGTRIGPPRQLLSGQSVAGPIPDCDRSAPEYKISNQTCVIDSADAAHYVDSLQAAGADMLKPRAVDHDIYVALATEARRLQLPFGGHATAANTQTAQAFDGSAFAYGITGPLMDPIEASDLGARIADHSGAFDARCLGSAASVEECRPIAERFQQHGTWIVPTLFLKGSTLAPALFARYHQRTAAFWAGTPIAGNWLRDSTGGKSGTDTPFDSSDASLRIAQAAGLPILAGTDIVYAAEGLPAKNQLPGTSLHLELALYVAEGLSTLNALQSATLNPAKMWHATDSLGTIAPGKLADLILLDADPLADITNTTAIRAVVANGRYFDRAALDELLRSAAAAAQRVRAATPPATPVVRSPLKRKAP